MSASRGGEEWDAVRRGGEADVIQVRSSRKTRRRMTRRDARSDRERGARRRGHATRLHRRMTLTFASSEGAADALAAREGAALAGRLMREGARAFVRRGRPLRASESSPRAKVRSRIFRSLPPSNRRGPCGNTRVCGLHVVSSPRSPRCPRVAPHPSRASRRPPRVAVRVARAPRSNPSPRPVAIGVHGRTVRAVAGRARLAPRIRRAPARPVVVVVVAF